MQCFAHLVDEPTAMHVNRANACDGVVTACTPLSSLGNAFALQPKWLRTHSLHLEHHDTSKKMKTTIRPQPTNQIIFMENLLCGECRLHRKSCNPALD